MPCAVNVVLCLLTAGDVALWDTRQPIDEKISGSRDKWQRVPVGQTDHMFEGDAVVENESLLAVFHRGSAGPVVRGKAHHDEIRLVPMASGGRPMVRITSVNIRKHKRTEVVLEIGATTEQGIEARMAMAFGRGRVFVTIEPIGNVQRIRIEAPTRFAVVPDLFGADMVFDPRAYDQATVFAPTDNFLVNLLDGGNAIVMSVWPGDEQQTALRLAGSDDARLIATTDVRFRGKPVYVALLQASRIWHAHRLRRPYTDKDIALGWRRPFQATWRANFCAGRRSDSWKFGRRKTKTWMYLYGSLFWPCWFEGDEARVHLTRKFVKVKGEMAFVLAYPMERTAQTPRHVFTPVDVVRETLGVGPCEYVLDREGLRGRSANTGRRSFGRGVCDTTSPIEYFFLRGLEVRDRAVVDHMVEDILADNRAINARVQEFRTFGKELAGLCATLRRKATAPPALLKDAERCATQIEDLYAKELPTIKTPARAAKLGKDLNALTEKRDPENVGKCKIITRELRDIAGTQHRMIGSYRVMVKTLRQHAGIHGAAAPEAEKAVNQIRQLARGILRRKYGVEAD